MTHAAALLPPVPAPPHDPYSIVLDWRAGWRTSGAVTNVELSPLDNSLVLVPAVGSLPVADAAGTFGGLLLPSNAVFGPDCILLVLDRKRTRLLRFDPCECVFVPLSCIAGEGKKPRQLASPGGMAASCGNLYIADAGNKRVQVFGLRGLPLRAIWQQPVALPQPWLPVAIAADQRARIFVGDANNGMVHVFAATGRYLRSLDGLGAIEHLTVDRDGRLYVQAAGEVLVIDADTWLETHRPLERHTRSDEVAKRFCGLPFAVTTSGHFKLCGGEFDANGDPAEPEPAVGVAYQTSGSMITVAIDSATYNCVWDRLELDGEFPEGTRVVASVYTSETPLPDAIISTLTDEWVACPPCDGLTRPWDCMLRAPAGRYLWLRLELASHGDHTPRIRKARVVFPRVSLRRYLPGTYGTDLQAAEFTDRFLAIFDQTFRGIESTLDSQAQFYDPSSAPAEDGRDFLAWLGTWIGVTVDRSWPLDRRRRYLKQVGKLFRLRGTLAGLRNNLQLYLGLPLDNDCAQPVCPPCTTKPAPKWRPPELVLEHYRLRRWMFLGAGRLGDEARVWGDNIVNRSRLDGTGCRGNARPGVTTLNTTQDPLRDPFWNYAHKVTVFAPASCARTPAARRGLERLVRAERPAHVAFDIVYVEPRFRIGTQSMIGFDTAIGRYPDANVTLGEAKLGRATVLGGHGPGDSMTVGDRARIGTTTRLR
ncbi:MAG: phage tail protein [Kofleriaceae bacterium]